MVDPAIKAGDVCHDLAGSGKVQVVARAADTVADYREHKGFDLATYKAHPLLGVRDDEPVFSCAYLPSDPTVSFGSNEPYSFPASRLARIPVEEAEPDLQRVQRHLAVDVLATLLRGALDDDAEDHWPEVIELCWPAERIDVLLEAQQLVQAEGVGVDG